MTTDVKLTQEQFGDINETSFYNILKQNGIVNITQTDKYSPLSKHTSRSKEELDAKIENELAELRNRIQHS